FSNLPVALPHVASGRLRPIAVTSRNRSPAAPDIPTIAESGIPGYEVISWYEIFAPAAVPAPVIDKLHRSLIAVLQDTKVQKTLVDQGGEVVASTGEEFAAFIEAELAHWDAVIRASGASAQ